MKIIPLLLMLMILTACHTRAVTSNQHDELEFSNIQSDYQVAEVNNYGCKPIDERILRHILSTGIPVTTGEIHDHFDTTGCSIKGQLSKNGRPVSFDFDYGGIFYFSDSSNLGCGKKCCENNFIYCTFSEKGLKGE